jgi:NADPH:quinone reductase-like Zn-dependent oxidoreductase
MSTIICKVIFAAADGLEVVSAVTAQPSAHSAGEVQMRVQYTSMGGADIQMHLGDYLRQRNAATRTPGYSLVGRVYKNGSGCSKFKLGNSATCLTMYDSRGKKPNYATFSKNI